MVYKTLVFSGGGTRCLVFCEILILLESEGKLKNICNYWGTSAGALIAALFAVTHSAAKVKELLFGLDFTTLRNVEVSYLLDMMRTWSMDDGTYMLNGIVNLFESAQKDSSKLLLKDVHGLNIVVADVTCGKTVVLNNLNYPSLRVVDAVRASMSLPIFISPFVSPAGNLWVDGGIRANFPWHLLSDICKSTALGLNFVKPKNRSPQNLSEYLLSVVHMDENKENIGLGQIINVPTPPFPAWFLKLSTEDYELIESLAQQSYNNWKNTKHKKPLNKLLRRWSF